MDCIPYINDLQLEIKILEDVKKSGHCAREEIDKKIKDKQELIERCKENISKLSDDNICYRLYLKILKGMKPSKAIEEISEENSNKDIKPTSISTLWLYYKKLKKII